MDRRGFLGALAASAAVTPFAFGRTPAGLPLDHVGVELYTVRDGMLKDFSGTLQKIARTGYKEVEFSGYFGHEPAEIRRVLDATGLTAPASHFDYTQLGAGFPKIVDDAVKIGHQYLVHPFFAPEDWGRLDAWKRAADAFNKAGELCKQAGIQFCHHNHHFEFAVLDGVMPYELLLKECDPELVKMELDLCWMAVARQDPLSYFRRFPGRFPLVHLKQLKTLPPRPKPGQVVPFNEAVPQITDVGPGVIDWKKVLANPELGGIKHYFVEHDAPKSPFDSIATSYRYLQNLKL